MAAFRASLARSAAWASVRSMNWPTWLPIALVIWRRSSSGASTRPDRNSTTPSTCPRKTTGNPNAPCSPTARATGARGRVPWVAKSGSHSAVFDSHTRPGSPAPGSNAMSRDRSTNDSTSAAGSCQASTIRRLEVGGSIVHIRPTSHPRTSHTSRRIRGAASSRVADSARIRATAYCAASLRSPRLRSVMSTETTTAPAAEPASSDRPDRVTKAGNVVPSLRPARISPRQGRPPRSGARRMSGPVSRPETSITCSTLRPVASCRVQPNRASASRFQWVTTPAGSVATTAAGTWSSRRCSTVPEAPGRSSWTGSAIAGQPA